MSALPLVLLQGTLCDQRLWDAVRTYLPSTTEIICPSYTLGNTMFDVVANMRTELPDKFFVVGFSLGGLAALELVQQAPDSVVGLALISSHAGVDTAESKAQRLRELEQAGEKGVESVAKMLPIKAGFATASPFLDANAALILEMAKSCEFDVFERQTLMAITRTDQHQTLSNFANSILILASQDDQMCLPSKPLLASKANKNARLLWIQNAGHYLPLEQPKRVAKELTNWMEDQA